MLQTGLFSTCMHAVCQHKLIPGRQQLTWCPWASKVHLLVPTGTVGGLMAGTWYPQRSSWALAATAAASSPTMSGTMGLCTGT